MCGAYILSKLILPVNFAQYDFIGMARKESNSKNRVRLLAMASIQDGKTLERISEVLKVHWKTIQSWLRNFRNFGLEGLYVKTTKARQSKLTKDIADWVVNFITFLNNCDTGGHITGKQLQKILYEQFALRCCLKSVYNLLHKLKFSWISSRSKHPKSDEEAQEQYKKFSTTVKELASA